MQSIFRTLKSFNLAKLKLYTIKQQLPIPASPSPGNHHSTFCLCGISLLQVPHRSGIMYASFCHWFITRSIMSLRFIHAVACVRISFFSKIEYSTVCMYILLIHSSTDGWHLLPPFGYCEQCCYEHECTNISMRPYFQFGGYIPRSGTSGLYGNSMF